MHGCTIFILCTWLLIRVTCPCLINVLASSMLLKYLMRTNMWWRDEEFKGLLHISRKSSYYRAISWQLIPSGSMMRRYSFCPFSCALCQTWSAHLFTLLYWVINTWYKKKIFSFIPLRFFWIFLSVEVCVKISNESVIKSRVAEGILQGKIWEVQSTFPICRFPSSR